MKEIWCFLDHTGWFRSVLEANRFTLWNEVILELQEYGVHPSKDAKILCTSVHNKQISMYVCTECTDFSVQPYRGGMNQ